MPATCALIGTPASISARQPPHTEAIDEEPFDSVISETTRIEYGELLLRRQHGDQRALGEAAVADLAALRRAHAAGLAGGERRHVVVEHEALAVLAGQRVDDLRVAPGAERRDDQRLRLAAREQRRAVGARQHAGADRRSGARCACRGRRCAARRRGSGCARSSASRSNSMSSTVAGVELGGVASPAALGDALRVISLQAPACAPASADLVGVAQRRSRPARRPWR